MPSDGASELVVSRDGGIVRIAFDRPRSKNALTHAMMADLSALLTGLASDESARVVVIEARGTDFCAGADMGSVTNYAAMTGMHRAEAIAASLDATVHPLARAIDALPQPIVAAVRGYAIGIGAQLMLMADLVVASETLKCMLPQVRLGHTLDHGESWHLPRLIGERRALQLALIDETIDGVAAERFGIVNWVVPDAELEQQVDRVVSKLIAAAPRSIVETKDLIRRSADRTFGQQLLAERSQLGRCAESDDFVEAVQAFREKRKPRFKGV